MCVQFRRGRAVFLLATCWFKWWSSVDFNPGSLKADWPLAVVIWVTRPFSASPFLAWPDIAASLTYIIYTLDTLYFKPPPKKKQGDIKQLLQLIFPMVSKTVWTLVLFSLKLRHCIRKERNITCWKPILYLHKRVTWLTALDSVGSSLPLEVLASVQWEASVEWYLSLRIRITESRYGWYLCHLSISDLTAPIIITLPPALPPAICFSSTSQPNPRIIHQVYLCILFSVAPQSSYLNNTSLPRK